MTYEGYLDAIHPDDRELAKTTVERAYSDRAPFMFDHRVQLPDGHVRWIHGRGRVIADETGTPVRMLGTAQDITEQRRIDDLRDSILSAVSHELRTPLTSIIGFAQTLKEKGGQLAETTTREVVDHLAQQARKLDLLLSDLLDLDRLRRGFVQPTFRVTDVGRLVSRLADGYTTDSHPVEVRAARALAEVDAPKVERIVDNLLANATRHTPRGTVIRVVVEESDEGVLIRVEDRGPGIVEEERERIFEIFNRGAARRGQPGTGIGLSLVSQFAALHGGRAWVEGNPGGGSSFRVFLPARRP